jgi:hypothetical protein
VITPAWEETMTSQATAAADALQAAVSEAARRLYDAEIALHIARQTGVGAWISAAYDRLHEAVVAHNAATAFPQSRPRESPQPRQHPAQPDFRPASAAA